LRRRRRLNFGRVLVLNGPQTHGGREGGGPTSVQCLVSLTPLPGVADPNPPNPPVAPAIPAPKPPNPPVVSPIPAPKPPNPPVVAATQAVAAQIDTESKI
jgi:hypothetical protein